MKKKGRRRCLAAKRLGYILSLSSPSLSVSLYLSVRVSLVSNKNEAGKKKKSRILLFLPNLKHMHAHVLTNRHIARTSPNPR